MRNAVELEMELQLGIYPTLAKKRPSPSPSQPSLKPHLFNTTIFPGLTRAHNITHINPLELILGREIDQPAQ
jgi:hypothetical protein